MEGDATRAALRGARRVLVKIGSSVLTNQGGLDVDCIDHLAVQLAAQRAAGREVVVVSSGAIAAGMRKRALPERPRTIPGKQAAAAA